jgi:DNA polymerase III delta prime subunit
MSLLSLWVEVYRPATLKGYVFKNRKMEEKIREWLNNPEKKVIPIPHLLLVGPAGVGKTSLAKIIINELHVAPVDVLEINASRENNVEVVRNKIVNFCSTWPRGDYKIVLLDEFDGFGQQAQGILRGEMEKYASSVRFIATGNYAHKIIPAIHSRFQTFQLDTLDMESYMERLIVILTEEKIKFDFDDLMPFVNRSYPDLRKGINLLEQNVCDNVLIKLDESSGVHTLDYMVEVVNLFKLKKYTEARKLICSSARLDDYEDIFRFLYRNLEMFGEDEITQSQAVIYISQGMRDDGLVSDREISMAATICRLSLINK